MEAHGRSRAPQNGASDEHPTAAIAARSCPTCGPATGVTPRAGFAPPRKRCTPWNRGTESHYRYQASTGPGLHRPVPLRAASIAPPNHASRCSARRPKSAPPAVRGRSPRATHGPYRHGRGDSPTPAEPSRSCRCYPQSGNCSGPTLSQRAAILICEIIFGNIIFFSMSLRPTIF